MKGFVRLVPTKGSGLVLGLLIGLLALGAPFARAADTHTFDPLLSLTGGCGVDEADPVADPGCPSDIPPSPFKSPRAVTTDFWGNIYVASFGSIASEGRVDVFDSEGVFITEVPVLGPISLAVDSKGNLYVYSVEIGDNRILRISPTVYNPAAGEIEYGDPPVPVADEQAGTVALAINPANDRLFAHLGFAIAEYGSAEEDNVLLDGSIGSSVLFNSNGNGLAIDATSGLIYASDHIFATDTNVVRVFELESPHELLRTFDGSTTPAGKFFNNKPVVAVDEGSGHFFVYDGGGANVVYEFEQDGTYLATIDHDFQYSSDSKIWMDNGLFSPNGKLNPNGGRYLFVPSHMSGTGHSFAFGPSLTCPPEVSSTSFGSVTASEAEIRADIEACSATTTYTFEYTTEQRFQTEGFAGATVAGQGQIPAAKAPRSVSAAVFGLSPGTAYRFRVVATNEAGSGEAQGSFSTYPEEARPPCPNDPLRTVFSALLPDCRAYELVTPADTNARAPIGVGRLGVYFATREASPAGDKVSFYIEGGLIPGSEGTGSYGGDPYLSSRSPDGWSTALAGPNGTESVALLPGSFSPDQGYSFWSTGGREGSAVVGGKETFYVRYPDGHSELIGRGSLGTDPQAQGKLISENGSHIIFTSTARLEPQAPGGGANVVYDRTSDGVTHVVSLLPGDKTPASGQDAKYVGASFDGRGIAFTIGDTLYLRRDNAATYEIGEDVVFAGVAEGGARIFYLEGGRLYRFDATTGTRLSFSTSSAVTPVNVSADGSAAYFVSPSVLTSQPNPLGAKAKAGQQNLYLSREGSISFVGAVTERDVSDEGAQGLGLWTEAIGPGSAELPGRVGIDPSRTTPDGNTIVFESRADLTGYASDGHVQVYRYDFDRSELQCLSCNPTGAAASGAASLASVSTAKGKPEPLGYFALVNNLRPDGRRAFFQSTEALVAGDTDGLQDVYEWEDQGMGSCARDTGCVYLISSGQSGRTDYLYAVSESGDDVFFRTSDLLVGADKDETPSIYDARVGGGFPELPEEESCQGEGCRPTLIGPPNQLAPESGSHLPAKSKRCPKGKRRVKRHGKVRCVKKHRRHKHHHKAGAKKKGGGK
jgi:hypothetical protein